MEFAAFLYIFDSESFRMEQSIYNIIPKEFVPPPKQSIYKSRYPANIPPTGSTFCHQTTSKSHNSNLSGEITRGPQAHTQFGSTKTLGCPSGQQKPDPKNYLKKQTGPMGNPELPPPKDFAYDCQFKKAAVPLSTEKPIQKINSEKNFIVSNAIENILSTAKRAPQPYDWTRKKDYGRVPDYLEQIKQNINNQYKMIRNLHEEHSSSQDCLSQEQINAIREGLKKKWQQINHEYQKHSHIRLVDTHGLKTRKEACQKQLGKIESDIKKLNKAYVFIE